MVADQGGSTRRLTVFFGLTFLVSWLIWLPSVLAAAGRDVPGILQAISQLGPFGPGVAALVMLATTEGRAAVGKLWRNAWSLRFEKRWLVPAVLLPPLVTGLTVFGMRVCGFAVQWEYSAIPLAMAMPIFLMIYLLNALPEEIGWRGYALPRLQTRLGVLWATVLLGVVHGVWHLPLHFMEGTTQSAIPVWEFIVKIAVGAVVYTWLYNESGSVFVVALYHAVGNAVAGLIPYWVTSEGRWISLGFDLLVVALILWKYAPGWGKPAGTVEAPTGFV